MKTHINKYILFRNNFVILFLIINFISNKSAIAQSYFHDNVVVPVFQGTIINNLTTKFDYWDLSEVNTANNRLDLVVGVSQRGYEGSDSGNYVTGNWYKNQYNDNFNSEVTGTRFLYSRDYTNRINGLIFAKLHSGANDKKDIIVTRENGDLEVYWNSGGEIIFRRRFKANGRVAAIGNFTSGDTLQDVAVIMNDTVKIYRNLGTGYLDSIPVCRIANIHANKVQVAQISSYYEPYASIQGTASDRDEVIISQGDSVHIYLNNNSNGISHSSTIYTGGTYTTVSDFQVADLNDDGYNDLVIVEGDYGINVYKNNSGSIGGSPDYSNTDPPFFHTQAVAVGDFDKNGFNDMAVALGDRTYLYLNNQSSDIFDMTPNDTLLLDINNNGPVTKMVVADLYNKGGLAILYSHHFDIAESNPYAPYNDIDKLVRINASDTDAVPAPSILVKRSTLESPVSRPKLLLYNRGDRDFLQYKIYKKNAVHNSGFTLFDSTSENQYIDYTEEIYYDNCEDPPCDEPLLDMAYYFVKVEDNSRKLSLSSDTITYETYYYEEEFGRPSNAIIEELNNKIPKEYSFKSYPNPFNPVSKILFDIPKEGNVKITVYNSIGQKMAELINEFKPAGNYSVEFNGSNFASGIYYYRIESNGFIGTKKMMLIK